MRSQEELHLVESRCTEEQPPACSAGCPLGMDVRAFLLAIKEKRFSRAWKIMEKSLPLPGVIARLCEAPCEQFCVRNQSDDALAISALEKVCLREAENPARIRPLPSRGKKVRCLGAGLSSLCCAWELAKKGYNVEVLTATEAPGAPFPELPEGVLEKELEKMRGLRVVFRSITDLRLDLFQEDADALFVGQDDPALQLHDIMSPEDLSYDPVTMQTQNPLVFTGGTNQKQPVISALSDGRQAAISIERLLQNASLTSARVLLRHGKTTLSPDLSTLIPEPQIKPKAKSYSQDEAALEAARCLDCHCLRCVKACVYLQEYGNFPRIHARNIFNNFSIYQGVHDAYSLIDSCSLCGQCEEICPSGFSMADICLDARRRLVKDGDIPPSAHSFALQEMQHAQKETSLLRHAHGQTSSLRLFYPGCQLAAIRPEQTWRLYQYLQEVEIKTGIWLDCCGAPAFWGGRETETVEINNRIHRQWKEMGSPTILTACSSCLKQFRQIDAIKAESVWTLLAQNPPDTMTAVPEILALSDPCSARHDTCTRENVRTLLEGCKQKLTHLPASGSLTECCGYGGLMENANSKLAQKVIAGRISQTDKPFLTYCAMCRDRLARGGASVYHLLDLLFPDTKMPSTAPFVTLSDRRHHRRTLKNRFLKECYGEKPMAKEPWSKMTLLIEQEVENLLDSRRILEEDLRKTLFECEQNNRFFTHTDGRKRAMAKIGEAFFWVEYRLEEKGFRILKGWSHRMVPEKEGEA